MPPPPEAPPTGQTDGVRAADDPAVVSSLRSALRDVYERYKAYKERSETLEAEASRKLGAYTAETAAMLRQWGSDPRINGAYVETQLQARNGQFKNIEGREADRQISNRASFEADLLSVLEDIVRRDGQILERNPRPRSTMSVDEPPATAPQPPVGTPKPRKKARPAEKATPVEQASQPLANAFEPAVQPSPTRSTRKRQRELDSPRASGQPESPRIKRTRRASEAAKAVEDTPGTQLVGIQPVGSPANSPRNPPEVVLPGKGDVSRKITFEEVYQGGKAKQKHAIITHPVVPAGTWFILKCECDDHVVHFGPALSALRGASRHLDIDYHKLSRSVKDAIEHLGWEVVGCDNEKAAANNAVFEQALSQGYIPINTRQNSSRRWFDGAGASYSKSPAETDPAKSTPAKAVKASPAKASPVKNPPITRAKGGELYYAWWPGDEKYYLCMIMPWDNSQDFGLDGLRQGIHGLGLLDKKQTRVPKCYDIDCDLEPPQIVGWSEGFEDGGPKESKRVFPALFFHSPNKKNQSSWTKASFLRAFDWRQPNFDVPGYKLNRQSVKSALEAMAKARGFSSFAQFETSQAAGASGESPHDEATTTPAQNGDGGVQNDIQVVDEEDESSSGKGQTKDGGRLDASPRDKGPEEAQTTNDASGEVQTDVSQSATESAPQPAENQGKSQPPAKEPKLQEKASVDASKGQSKMARDQPTANGMAPPAPEGVTQPPQPPQSGAPPKSSSPAGNGAMANGRSSPATTGTMTGPQATRPPAAAEAATDAAKKPLAAKQTAAAEAASDVTKKPLAAKKPAAAEAASDATTKPQAAKQPNATGPLLARKSVPGKKAPTASATPPATPAGSRPGAALPPKPNTANSPSTTPAPSKATTATRSGATLPSKPSKVSSPSTTPATTPAPSKATTASRSGAALPPKPSTVGTPSTNPASSKATTASRSVAGLPPKPPGVDGPSAAEASSKVANAQSPATTTVQTPVAKAAPSTPATNPPNGVRIQTQLAPPSQTGPRTRSSPAVSPADSPANSLRSASTPRNAASATDAQRFYLSEYEGPDNSWNAANDSERLILEIDPKTQTAKTGPGQPVTLEIDPKRVTSHAQFRDKPEPGKHTLTLNTKDSKSGTVNEHRLVFDQGGGVAASRQARRFYSWVTGW